MSEGDHSNWRASIVTLLVGIAKPLAIVVIFIFAVFRLETDGGKIARNLGVLVAPFAEVKLTKDGVEFKAVEKKVSEVNQDIQAQIAALQQKAKQSEREVQAQKDFNNDLRAKFDQLATAAKAGHIVLSKGADITQVSETVAANQKQTILIFYRTPRQRDANAAVQDLLDAGYKAAATESSLGELPIPEQPQPGTVVVQPNVGAGALGQQILASLGKWLPGGTKVELHPALSLRRGDIQIYMF